MKPDGRFLHKPDRFWANVKFISEQAGYSIRAKKGAPKLLKTYSMDDAINVYIEGHLNPTYIARNGPFFTEVVDYLNFRAGILNSYVQPLFMDRQQAAAEYVKLKAAIRPTRLAPMNKQSGEKKHEAYLAAMVSMIAEKTFGPNNFVDDARRLSVITQDGVVEGAFSRRFDGAFPDTVNPLAVWEIKEYYGTTTFGSRVADGVYETLLDGYEIEGARETFGREVKHYLFIDDRFTWWDCGRSYLCRMIDMLHTRHVDEIFFGREVLSQWEKTAAALVAR